MVLCYFNIRPKLKYKHIRNLLNEHYGVALTMRQLLQICKKLVLSRQISIDDGTLNFLLSNELVKISIYVCINLFVSVHCSALRLVAKTLHKKFLEPYMKLENCFLAVTITFVSI